MCVCVQVSAIISFSGGFVLFSFYISLYFLILKIFVIINILFKCAEMFFLLKIHKLLCFNERERVLVVDAVLKKGQ